MRRLFVSLIFVLLIFESFGQTRVAEEFGQNLKMWALTGSRSYRDNIERLCSGEKSIRVADKIAVDIAEKKKIPNANAFLLDTYLNGIEDAMDDGINIDVYDFVLIDKADIETIGGNAKYANELNFVSCKIKITGAMNYEVSDLLYIRGNKISKIDNYVIRQTVKGNKILVDLSDLFDNEQSLGATYNYSKDFPVGFSLNYSYTNFMISLDMGFCSGSTPVHRKELDMKDVMNYDLSVYDYEPKFFATITPSFYAKYFAVGCGFGALFLEGDENHYDSNYTTSGTSSSGSRFHYSTVYSECKFMIRPTLKGFIPISDEWFVSANLSYDYAFGYKKNNGLSFGIGLQYTFDIY